MRRVQMFTRKAEWSPDEENLFRRELAQRFAGRDLSVEEMVGEGADAINDPNGPLYDLFVRTETVYVTKAEWARRRPLRRPLP